VKVRRRRRYSWGLAHRLSCPTQPHFPYIVLGCESASIKIMYTYFWLEIVAFLASFFEYPAIKTSLPSPTTPPLCVHWIVGKGRQASCTNWRGLCIIQRNDIHTDKASLFAMQSLSFRVQML
jgi:hypothetical protein